METSSQAIRLRQDTLTGTIGPEFSIEQDYDKPSVSIADAGYSHRSERIMTVYRTPACNEHLSRNEDKECPWCKLDTVAQQRDNMMRQVETMLSDVWEQARQAVIATGNSGWTMVVYESIVLRQEQTQNKLDAAESRLDKYEQWFTDHAGVLASHNIGGFLFGEESAVEEHRHVWKEREGDNQNLYCDCGEVSRPLSAVEKHGLADRIERAKQSREQRPDWLNGPKE